MNDDIQGSAAVTVAGILAAGKFTGKDISSNTILFVGAGQVRNNIINVGGLFSLLEPFHAIVSLLLEYCSYFFQLSGCQ